MSNSASSLIGFFVALFLVLVVLKLMHYITWSWWWIAAPLWIPNAIGLLVASVALVSLMVWKASR